MRIKFFTQFIAIFFKNKNIVITPETIFESFPDLSEGIDYIEKTKDQIIVKVNTEIIGTQKALQELTKNFNIDDVDIQNESLEDIIRGIYEED